jgi:LysM repeat protein
VGDGWRRYAAPAAFLLAVTVAVVLVRSGLEHDSPRVAATTTAAKPPHKHVAATTTTTTTTKTTKPKSGARFWTVRAGDTFGVISSQTGVPVATIEQLNPNVSSTSLFIGEKIRIR